MPRDEGDWVGAQIYDSHEVVEEVCGWGEVDDDVLDEIRSVILFEDWAKRNYQVLNPDRLMRVNLHTFRDRVMHESRYVFMSAPKRQEFDPDELSSAELMVLLGQIISSTPGCLRVLAEGTSFFRGRMVDGDVPSSFDAQTLGPPPPMRSAANRMSPAGIPMFYGSDSPETVVAEIGAHSTKSRAVVGEFKTLRELQVVDLSALREVPSLFERSKRRGYYEISFLYHFAEELAKPVILDGREHIEYVPTQVFTEYLRLGVDYLVEGIVFPSSQGKGRSCALFCDSRLCVESEDPSGTAWLALQPTSLMDVRVVSTIACE